MTFKEFTGKNVEEAIRTAMAEFSADLGDLDIEILSQGKRGMLGVGGEEARILAAPKSAVDAAETIRAEPIHEEPIREEPIPEEPIAGDEPIERPPEARGAAGGPGARGDRDRAHRCRRPVGGARRRWAYRRGPPLSWRPRSWRPRTGWA